MVATDLTASAWRLDVPPPAIEGPEGRVLPEVTVQDAARGAPLPNLAVVALDAEPDPTAGPRGYRITAAVSSAAGEARKDVSLQLSAGAGPGAKTAIRAFVDLPAGGTVRKALSYAFPQGGPAVLQVALPEDSLAMDDARALALVVPREVRALVVDGAPSPVRYRDEAYFVESALASPASPVRPTLVDAEALAGEDLAKYDVVFLLNVRSVGAKAAELERFVENGGGLFLAVGDEVDPEAYGRELGKLLPMPLHVVKTAGEPGRRFGARGAVRGRGVGSPGAVGLHRGRARGPPRRADVPLRARETLPEGRGRDRARELRRRRSRARRGPARQGAGTALHLQRRSRLDGLANPHELPPRDAALRRVPGGCARGAARAARSSSARSGRSGSSPASGSCRSSGPDGRERGEAELERMGLARATRRARR